MGITLRKKQLKNGGYSLYLDIINNGRRTFEFLNIHLGKNPEVNKENMRVAKTIRARREEELVNDQYNMIPSFKGKTEFIGYFEIKTKNLNTVNKFAVLYHLRAFSSGISIKEIDRKWLTDFQNFLLTRVSNNTAKQYFNYIKKVLKKAVIDGIIQKNPSDSLEKIKGTEVEKSFLTIDEVQKLAETDCPNPETKRAFLFSCYTGLRISDIRKLSYNDIKGDNIQFRQQKTGRIEYLPLNETAKRLIACRTSNIIDLKNDLVFRIEPHESMRGHLKRWAKNAGIEKNISFHTARHSFATIALAAGNDIYTVSKLLGHRSINTTQIYAKIINETLRQAVDKLPDITIREA